MNQKGDAILETGTLPWRGQTVGTDSSHLFQMFLINLRIQE